MGSDSDHDVRQKWSDTGVVHCHSRKPSVSLPLSPLSTTTSFEEGRPHAAPFIRTRKAKEAL